ncbi:anhydro-N-acetylmuramic acid kinase [Marinicauda salina]|uniref:Anhydro-N-acetylmuramic acid kinase n=1 Tax=Marinicauda salina TaxID=2135793 RepID=A0A2U2BTH8_9PROT|nr:anhydro-N-acetylmuramic acid kinase [Marinicauda salina]PWE17300.1 anhydro-N-acetylmuramic acid kinase [Marinicauda salina]
MKVVGLMSGTSLDGVDAALMETDGETVARFGPGLERAYAPGERRILQAAVDAARAWRFEGPEPAAFAEAETVLTTTHAEAVAAVCEAAGIAPSDLDLVGFHGQTVLHRAPAEGVPGRTRQLGDGAALAARLGCDVAFDFRSADVAAGGQGAPLAPVYHRALADWSGLERPLGVLNLGGVANITLIASDGALVAFDTGPANGLIDAFMEQRTGEAMDANGETAARGRVHEAAFAEYLAHDHFAAGGPKSLDRWDFDLDAVANLSTEDGAATLTAFTARSVALGVERLPERPARLIVCGGGRKNATLRALIEAACDMPAIPAEDVGWRGDLIEAEAFAFLAARCAAGRPISFPGTTGVSEPMTGGRIARG